LSSAEDMNLLTTPPAAESREGAGSEPAVVPTQPAESAAPVESPPEEAVVTPEQAAPAESQLVDKPVELEPLESPQPEPKPLLKPNMIAHEVRLTAAFPPVDPNAIDRTLFKEETTSILVCDSGGIIHLSAAVVPGQLLFLTNIESRREVVAQVKRKRTFRPTLCYVEIEFVEAAPRFWGMDFSAASALLPKNAKDAEAAAAVMAAEATADQPGELPASPYEEEIRAFKREVRALGSPKPAQSFLESLHSPSPASSGPSVPETPASLPIEDSTTTTNYGHGEVAETGSTGEAIRDPSPPGAPWAQEAQSQSEVPLDFSISLPKKRRSLRARGSFTPNFRGGMLRLALLVGALAVTVVGAAWYKHWLPWQASAGEPSNGRPTIGLGPNPKVASDAPITSAGAISRNTPAPDVVPAEPKKITDPSEQTASNAGIEAEPVVKKFSPAAVQPTKRPADRSEAKPSSESASNGGAGGTFVPPKLIKSVRAVASLEELRDFETGNVVIDAVVGSSGEVNFISVLSGPPSLRPAAVESLKQYQYEPATCNGQPVPAHVTITIHFRFEP